MLQAAVLRIFLKDFLFFPFFNQIFSFSSFSLKVFCCSDKIFHRSFFRNVTFVFLSNRHISNSSENFLCSSKFLLCYSFIFRRLISISRILFCSSFSTKRCFSNSSFSYTQRQFVLFFSNQRLSNPSKMYLFCQTPFLELYFQPFALFLIT